MPTPRFELSVRGLSGLVANLYAADPLVQSRVRTVNTRFGAAIRQRVADTCAYDTGFMSEHARDTYTPSGLTFEVGWDASDFFDAGKAFYPEYVEFGTVAMAAQPSLLPAFDEYSSAYEQAIGDEIRAAIDRLGSP